uniref:Uncharacterized protein n=1 Tax=Lepeophtheirus salmonis TaxID=72036 RepID=A0A0K2UBI4_LEPSM
MKRHKHYSFSPPKHSSTCQSCHFNFQFLFLTCMSTK